MSYIHIILRGYKALLALISEMQNIFWHSRTPEIETQSHAGLNLSQFQTDYLLRTEILNHLTLFESILGIVTTLTNENIGTLRYLRPSYIGTSCFPYFLSMVNASHCNLRIFKI